MPVRRRPSPRRWIGRWLIFVGVAHCSLAIAVHGDVYRAMAAAGGWNTLDRTLAWDHAFWFLACGVALLLFGLAVDGMEAAGSRIAPALGWGLLGLSVAGIVVAPLSGFWALLAGAVGILHRAYRAGSRHAGERDAGGVPRRPAGARAAGVAE